VLFRAVPVPAGHHVLEMRYRPRAVVWGLALTLLGTAAVCLVGLVRSRPAGDTLPPRP
jgi:hypothetical protein